MMATEEEWAGARARSRRVANIIALVGTVVVAALAFPAAYLTELVGWSYQKALGSLSKVRQFSVTGAAKLRHDR